MGFSSLQSQVSARGPKRTKRDGALELWWVLESGPPGSHPRTGPTQEGLLGGVRIEYDGDQQGGRKEKLQTTVGKGQSQPAMYVNYTKPTAGSPVVLEKCS